MKFNALVPELLVSNIDETIKFYVDLLGFNIVYKREEDKFYFVERQGAQIMLEELEENTPYTNTIPTKPFGRGMNFEIITTDIDPLYSRIRQANYPIHFALEDKWYPMANGFGGTRQFMVTDPDGYLLRFSQDIGTSPTKPQ